MLCLMYLLCSFNLYSSSYNEKNCPSCQRPSWIWPSLRWLWFPSRPDGSVVWAVRVCVLCACVRGRRAVRGGPAAAAAVAAAAASWREDCSHPGSLLCPRAAVLLVPTWTFNLFNMWPRTERRTQHMSGGWGPAEQGQFALLPFYWQELGFLGSWCKLTWLKLKTIIYRIDELQTLVPETYISTSDVRLGQIKRGPGFFVNECPKSLYHLESSVSLLYHNWWPLLTTFSCCQQRPFL